MAHQMQHPSGEGGSPSPGQGTSHDGLGAEPRRGSGPPSDRRFAAVLIIAGILGWLASAQLTLERLAVYADPGYVTSCDLSPFVSCGAVFRTWQAQVFGFPNPLLGIVAFAVVATTGMALLAGARLNRWYWLWFQGGVTAGALCTAWLWYQALFEISLLCIYCMVVWAVMIVLTVRVTARNASSGVLPVGRGAAGFLSEWTWVIIAVLLLAAAASVFLRFADALVG